MYIYICIYLCIYIYISEHFFGIQYCDTKENEISHEQEEKCTISFNSSSLSFGWFSWSLRVSSELSFRVWSPWYTYLSKAEIKLKMFNGGGRREPYSRERLYC